MGKDVKIAGIQRDRPLCRPRCAVHDSRVGRIGMGICYELNKEDILYAQINPAMARNKHLVAIPGE